MWVVQWSVFGLSFNSCCNNDSIKVAKFIVMWVVSGISTGVSQLLFFICVYRSCIVCVHSDLLLELGFVRQKDP
jgi:hypothetical protein